jgi:hypothetical protein
MRFTIRDLLWLMVVVGLFAALVLTRAQFRSMQAEIERQRERLLWADIGILRLAEGWKQDSPEKIDIEDDYINIRYDKNGETYGESLRRPRAP